MYSQKDSKIMGRKGKKYVMIKTYKYYLNNTYIVHVLISIIIDKASGQVQGIYTFMYNRTSICFKEKWTKL